MFIDLILKFIGRRPMLVRLLRRVYVANCVVSYFTFHEREYNNINSLALMSSIPPDNLDMFSFNYSYINIRDYYTKCTIGIKKFLLHEDINRLDAAKAHYKRVSLLVRVVKTIISIGMLWMIYKWSIQIGRAHLTLPKYVKARESEQNKITLQHAKVLVRITMAKSLMCIMMITCDITGKGY
ncbi:PREDICTED: uncharacterized protein LOC105448719 [Wasmannia auropunctata]|uniref:uncharacterized protein LOC105448719 n=1 Tax=Wasmannia auropunctata TaxID=64793 RepID=UPI0005EE9356|nr:PREDICTED: uncharacterized protein LOC105448719 [Wasmannia auropunctata]